MAIKKEEKLSSVPLIKDEGSEEEISIQDSKFGYYRLTQVNSRRSVQQQLENPHPDDTVRNYAWYHRRSDAAEEILTAKVSVTVSDEETRRVARLQILALTCSGTSLPLLLTQLTPVIAKLRAVLVYSYVDESLESAFKSSGFIKVISLVKDQADDYKLLDISGKACQLTSGELVHFDIL